MRPKRGDCPDYDPPLGDVMANQRLGRKWTGHSTRTAPPLGASHRSCEIRSPHRGHL